MFTDNWLPSYFVDIISFFKSSKIYPEESKWHEGAMYLYCHIMYDIWFISYDHGNNINWICMLRSPCNLVKIGITNNTFNKYTWNILNWERRFICMLTSHQWRGRGGPGKKGTGKIGQEVWSRRNWNLFATFHNILL